MVDDGIRHIVAVVHIVHTHQFATFVLDLLHVLSGEEVVVEHYYLIAREKVQEGLELGVLVESHEGTHLLHLPYLIGRWGGGEEGAFEVILEHVGKRKGADEMSVPDGCTGVCSEVDFFLHLVKTFETCLTNRSFKRLHHVFSILKVTNIGKDWIKCLKVSIKNFWSVGKGSIHKSSGKIAFL